jgi:trehalose 6-phosphate synthase/phosphatase
MKLIIVSNRLPVSISDKEGQMEVAPSPGGLASGLRTYLGSPKCSLESQYMWIGWPGGCVRPELQPELIERCEEQFCALPVFLSKEETEDFYEGFCNNTLWPLFHYFPSMVAYNDAAYASYERVNSRYCDAVLDVVEKGDLVWVHDYHLLLLPAMLRRRLPNLRIGFFLHIPFPSFELFRMLPEPWRRELLEGLLGADLVGFHTHDYTQHFLRSVRRILGHEHEMGQIVLGDRVVKAGTYPMGIEFDFFSKRAKEEEVIRLTEELRRPLGDSRIILSIDRLDYTKGIVNRLLGFQAFLEANPSWHGEAVLLMVVVPSRTGVDDYQRMKTKVDELVGSINGRFGTLTWTPILYQYKSFPQEQLVPLYSASDVMLVTPLRDGMNLIAKEYIASRAYGTGVLILSEMAGAASELGEAVMVNPNDVPGIARALKTALETPLEIQRDHMAAMRKRLRRYDLVRWATEFLEALRENRMRLDHRMLLPVARQRIIKEFQSAGRRLLLCDYRGTLVSARIATDKARPDTELLATLRRLAKHADVVLMSEQPRDTLESWFGYMDITLAAEHGAWIREPDRDWAMCGALTNDWKLRVRELMELYADRLPGASVEEKEVTLAWHYRRAEPDLAAVRARELADHLISLTETTDLKVVEGSYVIEVRPSSVSKAACCQPFLARDYDFILALGDDNTDEELFKILPPTANSIRVGLSNSNARFNVYSQTHARELLVALANALADRSAIRSLAARAQTSEVP